MKRWYWACGIGALLGGVAAAFVWWPRASEPQERWAVPVSADPSRGPANAAVTIVEFCDFDVRDCANVAPTMRRVLNEYPEDVRLVWKDYPQRNLGARGLLAAQIARLQFQTSGNEAFWTAHDTLFAGIQDVREPLAQNLAQLVGETADDLTEKLKSPELLTPIQDGTALAKAVGVVGLPYFFINGRPLAGARSYQEFKEIIEQELERSETLLSDADHSKPVYDVLVQVGQVPDFEPRAPEAARDDSEASPSPAKAVPEEEGEDDVDTPRPRAAATGRGPAGNVALTEEERKELQRRGFDVARFQDFAARMQEKKRLEDELRADRRAKGLPGGNP